jgi:hypothetical protein
MKLQVVIAGVVCVMGNGLRAADTTPAKGDPRAAALMRESARTRYTWSPEVTGVAGKFTWKQDGKTGSGSFRDVLHKRGGFSATAEGNLEVPAGVKDHISSLISHRAPPAAGAPERPAPESVIIVEDEERGPLIMTVGDRMQSTQRVKDGKLVQVNRMMGGKRFTIDVTEFEKSPDGRFYPSAFIVTWWDAASGKKLEKQSYSTLGFDLIEGQMFPKAEKVVSDKGGQTSTLEIQYSEIKFEMAHPKAEGR